MAQLNIEVLTPIADGLTEGTHLTPAERAEVLRIAQGFACKDSARAASVSPETIRARRKRIYRKLGVAGATETLSLLLAESLAQLASTPRKRLQIPQQPQGQRRPDQTDGSASALGVEAADAAGVRLALGRAALASSKQDHHVRVEHG